MCAREREGVCEFFFLLNTVFTYKEPRTSPIFRTLQSVFFHRLPLKAANKNKKSGGGVGGPRSLRPPARSPPPRQHLPPGPPETPARRAGPKHGAAQMAGDQLI